MILSEINPYVRFARTENNVSPSAPLAAFDHRIFFCTGGRCSVQAGGETYELKENSLLYWHSGTVYRYIDTSAQFIGCNFDFVYSRKNVSAPITPKNAEFFDENLITENVFFEDEPLLNSVIFIENAAPLRSSFEKIKNEFCEKRLYYSDRCGALLKDIIAYSLRMKSIPDFGSGKKTTAEIIAYIEKNYDKKITNSSIGEKFNYHPNYISRLMTEHTGMPLHRYIINYRIHRALLLLESGDMTVSQIAESVGMPDLKHFSKCFKSVTGVCPSDYRRA